MRRLGGCLPFGQGYIEACRGLLCRVFGVRAQGSLVLPAQRAKSRSLCGVYRRDFEYRGWLAGPLLAAGDFNTNAARKCFRVLGGFRPCFCWGLLDCRCRMWRWSVGNPGMRLNNDKGSHFRRISSGKSTFACGHRDKESSTANSEGGGWKLNIGALTITYIIYLLFGGGSLL